MLSQSDHDRRFIAYFDQLGKISDYLLAANELVSFDPPGLNDHHDERQGSVWADHDARRLSCYERSSQIDKKGRGEARAAVGRFEAASS